MGFPYLPFLFWLCATCRLVWCWKCRWSLCIRRCLLHLVDFMESFILLLLKNQIWRSPNSQGLVTKLACSRVITFKEIHYQSHSPLAWVHSHSYDKIYEGGGIELIVSQINGSSKHVQQTILRCKSIHLDVGIHLWNIFILAGWPDWQWW